MLAPHCIALLANGLFQKTKRDFVNIHRHQYNMTHRTGNEDKQCPK